MIIEAYFRVIWLINFSSMFHDSLLNLVKRWFSYLAPTQYVMDSSLSSERLCVFGLHGAIYVVLFCLHPLLYILVSWAWWDWPLTRLTNNHLSVLRHFWLGHLTCKIVPEMTYNVSSGTSNLTTLHCEMDSLSTSDFNPLAARSIAVWKLAFVKLFIYTLTKVRYTASAGHVSYFALTIAAQLWLLMFT